MKNTNIEKESSEIEIKNDNFKQLGSNSLEKNIKNKKVQSIFFKEDIKKYERKYSYKEKNINLSDLFDINEKENIKRKEKIFDNMKKKVLKEIDRDGLYNGNIVEWNTSNITEMESMFKNNIYTSLKSQDLNPEKVEKKLSVFHRMIDFFRNIFINKQHEKKEIQNNDVVVKKPDFPQTDEFQNIYNELLNKIHLSSSFFSKDIMVGLESIKDSYYKIIENTDTLNESSKREIAKSIRGFLPKLIESYIAIPLKEINETNKIQIQAQEILMEGINEISETMQEAVLEINENKLSELSIVTRTIKATLN